MIGLLTVTSQLALTPFSALTVIVVVPAPFAVTLPVALTIAIVGSSLSQLNSLLSVVSLGVIVARSPCRVLMFISIWVLFSVMDVIGFCSSSTCTLTSARAPVDVSALMIASPPRCAVITPFSTEAISLFVDSHVRSVLLATE